MKIKATGDLFTVDARGLLRSRSFEYRKTKNVCGQAMGYQTRLSLHADNGTTVTTFASKCL